MNPQPAPQPASRDASQNASQAASEHPTAEPAARSADGLTGGLVQWHEARIVLALIGFALAVVGLLSLSTIAAIRGWSLTAAVLVGVTLGVSARAGRHLFRAAFPIPNDRHRSN